MNRGITPQERLLGLRRDFDQSFALARDGGAVESATLLAIRLRGDGFALRLSELRGLFAGRKVTPLPGTAPELLGLAGMRGSIVAVYDLGALLGYPVSTTSRWLVVPGAEPTLSLAFDSFEGAFSVPIAELAPDIGPGVQPHQQIRELARTASGSRPIIHLPSLLARIAKRDAQPNI